MSGGLHERLGLTTIVVIVALLGVSRSVAVAQQGWTGTITNVSPVGVSPGAVRLAADPAGTLTAVWQESASDGFVVKAARGSTATGTCRLVPTRCRWWR